MVCGSADLCDRGGATLAIALPLAVSTIPTGAPNDPYSVDEDVCAAGSGFTTGTSVDIHVVPDQDWNDGDPIPSDITASVEKVFVVNSNIAPVLVWNAPLVIGEYDIVVDANRNGIYDASIDGIDGRSPGFVVIGNHHRHQFRHSPQ